MKSEFRPVILRFFSSAALFALVTTGFCYHQRDVLSPATWLFLAALAVPVAVMGRSFHLLARQAAESIRAHGDRLTSLLSASPVHGTSHSDILIEKIMNTAVQLTRADGGTLYNVAEDDLEFAYVAGPLAGKLQGTRIPKGTGIVGSVVREGRSLRIDDAKADKRHFVDIDSRTQYVTRSILCVPLLMDGKVVGVLQMVKSEPNHFTADDEKLLRHFGTQAAQSMKTTQYVEDMKNLEMHLTNLLVDALENVCGKKGHLKKVAKYSLLIGRAIGLPESDMKALYQAAILHDIGFLKIDMPGVTSVRDYYAHAQHGYDMLKQITFYRTAASYVLHHHERYDGYGYPGRLKGEMIPLASRIIAIAEAFDVMTNSQSFKKVGRLLHDATVPTVFGFQRALEELKENAGTQFDPQLVEAFLKNVTDVEPDQAEAAVGSLDSCAEATVVL